MLEEAGVELVVRSQASHHRDTESTEKSKEK
jgi:hypothetical protein